MTGVKRCVKNVKENFNDSIVTRSPVYEDEGSLNLKQMQEITVKL